MRWVLEEEAARRFQGRDRLPQELLVLADLARLARDIPTPPRLVPPSEGPPSPMLRWCGMLGARPVVLECMEGGPGRGLGPVEIITPFLTPPAEDWTILRELKGLPASIFLTRPFFVKNRAPNPSVVVYRPAPEGYDHGIYWAASWAEAQRFLEFLGRDEWNEGCRLGQLEPPGHWGIVRQGGGPDQAFAAYPDRARALSVACRLSEEGGENEALTVLELSGVAPDERYRVSGGRVVGRKPRNG